MWGFGLFHSLAEMVSVVIAGTVFALTWNTQEHRASGSGFFLVLGIASLFVGAIDLVHALAYKGMSVFPRYDSNLPTQLWVAARYLQSLSLLAAAILLLDAKAEIRGPKARYLILAVYAVISATLMIAIFSGIFPACYVEGSGLTGFKRWSEYAICGILVCAALILRKGRALLDAEMLRYLIAAIVFSILTELAFTLYVDIYGLMNGFGHILKVLVFLLLYKAIVLIGLKRPSILLSRELRESEARYRAIIDAAPVPMALNDDDQRITYLNPAFVRTFGYTAEDIPTLGDWWPRAYPDPEYRRWVADSWEARLAESRRDGTPFAPLEVTVRAEKGEEKSVLATAAAFVGTAPRDHLVVLYDISDRKNDEERIKRLARQLDVTLATVTVGISHVKDRRIVWANAAFDTTFGCAPGASIGQETSAFYRDRDDYEAFGKEAYPALDEGRTFSAESPMKRSDGTIFWCALTGRLIDAARPMEGSIWMTSDISERKKVQAELEGAAAMNRNLMIELQHRVKNSFFLITSMVSLTASEVSTPETSAALAELDSRVRSISQLYSLLYSSGSFSRVRLDLYCAEVTTAMSALGGSITLESALEPITVEARLATPIGLILTELLTNAYKYAFPGGRRGRITITLRAMAPGARLEVIDDGIGLPDGFDAAQGSGLLLVEGLAGQVRGEFAIRSKGRGTGCTLDFPLE